MLIDRTDIGELLVAAVGLGSGFHDLGKLTIAFGHMLLEAVVKAQQASTHRKQPIRHELISLIILAHAIKVHGPQSDLQFLSAIAEPQAALAVFTQALADFKMPKDLDGTLSSSSASLKCLLPDRRTHPFMRGVADLVISHHKLAEGNLNIQGARPGAKRDASTSWEVDAMDGRHVTARWHAAVTPMKDFTVAATAAAGALCDPSTKWHVSVASDARRALSVLKETSKFGRREWIGATYHYGRLALMLGDHQASKKSVPRPMSPDAARAASLATCFANTRQLDERRRRRGPDDFPDADEVPFLSTPFGNGPHLADTWAQHTHKVRRRALAALGHLMQPREWPSVPQDELPLMLRDREKADSAFRWQDDCSSVMAQVTPEHPLGAWLVLLMSSTGTGKTIMVQKVLAAISPDGVRANVALGLRSLTLQTGDDYQAKIGFTPDQVVISIGSAAAQALHEMVSRDTEADASAEPETLSPGTDAQPEVERDIIVGGNADPAINHLAARTADLDENKERRRRMLATPILVSTVDRLMSAADARGGGHLGDTLRLFSADLVIDEIDSFGPEDLVALARLVRAAAAYGRSVVVASATMRHGHAAVIRDAFAAGRRDWAALHGANADFGTAWVSEHDMEMGRDDARADRGMFSATHREVAARMAAAVAASDVRRKAIAVQIPSATRQACLSAAFTAGFELHGANHVVDPETKVRVSVGIVRWNHVRSARDFAAYAATVVLPDGVSSAFICYHAKYALSVRNAVYGSIARMLSRKPSADGSDPLLADPFIRSQLSRVAAEGGKDLVCYLSTTNIIEAGCDLDADWGVTEPCSERSVLQFAGRIRRHRLWAHDEVNMGILETTMPSGHPVRRIERPGVETPIRLGRGHPDFRFNLSGDRKASSIFPMQAWSLQVDSSGCLVDADSACARAEIAMLEGACLGEPEAISKLSSQPPGGEGNQRLPAPPSKPPETARVRVLSVASLSDAPEVLWTDYHPKHRMFRRQDGTKSIAVAFVDGEWFIRDEASINKAKAEGKKGGRHEWTPSNHRVVRDHSLLASHPGARERLLLPEAFYEVEEASRDVESRRSVVGDPAGKGFMRELRTASLQLPSHNPAGGLVYNPWLGLDTSRTRK